MSKKPNNAPEGKKQGADGLLAAARRLFHTQRTEAVQLVKQALNLALDQNDHRLAAQALNLLADADRLEGRMGSALSLATEALKHADSSGDLASRADALNNLGLLAWHRADFDQAIEYLTSALSLREELGTEHSIAATCNNLSLVYWERGDLTEALEFQQRSLGLKELIGDRYGIGVSQLNLGLIYVDLGDWDKALECYFRALAEKEQSGDKADIALCYNNIGELYLKRGRLDRASFYLEQALKLAKAAPSRWVESEVLGNLGECAFEQHNLSRALNCYQEDRRICLETDDKEELAETLRRWAELDLAQGQFESCRTRIGEALTLCEKTGARRELGNVHRLLGELAAKLGERAQARSELEQAVAIFRTIGKNYELARALTSLGLVLSEEPKGEGGAELSEALVILRNLGVEARARELEQLLGHGPEAPKQDFQMPAPLLSELVHLAATSSDLDQFCAQALNLITRELPIPGAAIVLRNGRVFQIDDTGNRQTTTITLALELNRLRLGTLVVSLGTDALADTSLVHQKQLAPLAELVALGIFHAQSQPAPLPSRTQPILDRLPKIIGAETTLREVFDTIRQVAPTRANVLILGESGTGKELVARTLHELSDRKDGPFVVVNCAAIPETLLESELFGIEKGTATGVTERKGRFEAASGGTVFLDEIGDMSLGLQAKLLRVLQDRTFERVGGRKPITADVRIIAATNRNLEAAASQGLFRPDLYYRLSVITITLPALRIRKPDIPELVAHFVTRFSNEYGKRVQGVTQDCLACLCSYEWPGNVRELENVLERAVILSRTELLTIDDLPPNIQRRMAEAGAQGTGWRETRRTAREQAEAHLEMDAIRTALEHSGWVIKRAAQQLGISRRHLYRLMHKHNIRRPERQSA